MCRCWEYKNRCFLEDAFTEPAIFPWKDRPYLYRGRTNNRHILCVEIFIFQLL